MKGALYLVATTLLISISWVSCINNSEEPIADIKPIQTIIDSLGLSNKYVWVYVDKSDYKLTVFIDSQEIKTYNMVLGFNPVDDKKREGDGCTPEGTFELIDLYPHAKWSKFMWIGYPNAESWWKFEANKEAGLVSDTYGIGGEIGIHGVPEGMDHLIDDGNNWTLGCISLKNKDVDELYSVVKKGTKIVIEH